AGAGAHVTTLVEATPWQVLARRLWPLLLERAYTAEGISLAWHARGVRKLFGVQVAKKESGSVALSNGRAIRCDTLLVCDIDKNGVIVDQDQRTSCRPIFAAGEVTGIAGSRVAEVEGRLAGLAV